LNVIVLAIKQDESMIFIPAFNTLIEKEGPLPRSV
jgi:uncharacterized protein YqcC (DUF446 family)